MHLFREKLLNTTNDVFALKQILLSTDLIMCDQMLAKYHIIGIFSIIRKSLKNKPNFVVNKGPVDTVEANHNRRRKVGYRK